MNKKLSFAHLAPLLVLIQACSCKHVGSSLDSLPTLKDYRAARVSSHDRTGGNADALHAVPPGETVVLADIEGPGMITHIWFTIAAEKWHGRKIVLRMYWDDEKDPSVLCPVNDFFCAGHGINANVWSLPITVTSNGRARNCFFKMPFNERARIEITNEGLEPIRAFYYYIDYRKYARPFRNIGYFHARYRQEYPAVDERNYVICEAKGRGHYVGCNLSIESNGDGWWGEGDDRFFVDGESYPSFHGTGSEDYLCDAWGIWPGSSPYYGSSIHEGADYAKGKRYTSYRFHIEDPVPFQESLLVEIEHYGARIEDGKVISGFTERGDNWSSVAYWYQTEPHLRWGPLAPVDQRLPQEAGKEIALLRFLRKAWEYQWHWWFGFPRPPDDLRETYNTLRSDPEMHPYLPRITARMALVELWSGNKNAARRLVQPYAEPFVQRDLAHEILEILREPGKEAEEVKPLLVDSGDGSVERVEKDGRFCVVTSEDKRKPYIYFALPENCVLRNSDDTIVATVEYYSTGTEGDTFQIEYDSFYSDDISGYYRATETVAKPAEPGWHQVTLECPRARLAGHQNSRSDFRIASMGDGDEFISAVRVDPKPKQEE
jgi:hypothetical protein